MTTLNCTVTRATTLTKDANDRYLITKDILHLLGEPTVTVDVTDGIDTVDIKDDAVTGAKLANAISDKIVTASVTVGSEATNDVQTVIQAQDSEGNSLSDVVGVWVWYSSSAGAGPTSLPTGGSPTVDTGTKIEHMSSSQAGLYLTDSTGLLELTLTDSGTETGYINVMIQNIYIPGDTALVWT